jgi:hypothetical protein
MILHVTPPVSEAVRSALARALVDAGLVRDGIPDGYASPWWRAAAREAVTSSSRRFTRHFRGEASEVPYAPSPRRTRGATRA